MLKHLSASCLRDHVLALSLCVVECPHPHPHASGDIPLLIDGTTAEFQVGPDWVVSMQIVDKMNSFSSPKQ